MKEWATVCRTEKMLYLFLLARPCRKKVTGPSGSKTGGLLDQTQGWEFCQWIFFSSFSYFPHFLIFLIFLFPHFLIFLIFFLDQLRITEIPQTEKSSSYPVRIAASKYGWSDWLADVCSEGGIRLLPQKISDVHFKCSIVQQGDQNEHPSNLDGEVGKDR